MLRLSELAEIARPRPHAERDEARRRREVSNVEDRFYQRLAGQRVSHDLAGEAAEDQPRRLHQATTGEDSRLAPTDRQALTAMPERQLQQLAEDDQQRHHTQTPHRWGGASVPERDK